ncbi:SanA protein [Balneicella halophila]|uniref:SanA protein n=1 Tax=Balneicella halophila TaxID=1537566 RepID=A0A7L4UTD4_BALHA|nr:ElyC/SanA/YdcF family protein [Balneicella halophila]PVX52627.1 SanA protein [Balneicella halophila]
MKTWQYVTLYSMFYLSFFILISHQIVEAGSKDKLCDDTELIPSNDVGLLLGTSKYVRKGRINLYYKYRIEATVALFRDGKIQYVLVSGDNSTQSYNEPTTMQKDLIKAGIPPEKIYLDYAGFRTFDSVVRSKVVFGQDNITIISQPFHNKRALFIAQHKGINAIAFNARSVNPHYGFKTNLREIFARCKMVLDLIFGNQPKFLGEKIVIE